MPIEPLFGRFRELISRTFERAKADGGIGVSGVQLTFSEEPHGTGRNRAEVVVIGQSGPVCITWNAIASLWLISQGSARLSKRMFEARRRGEQVLVIADDVEVDRGLKCLVLADRFRFAELEPRASHIRYWPEWAAPIDLDPIVQSDTWNGNQMFEAALGWIFRHELAHLVLRHNEVQISSNLKSQDLERAADITATEWLRGGLNSDANRVTGTAPSIDERQLETRAISIGTALLWVAFMEAGRSDTNTSHPSVADRIYSCYDVLSLREDSGAKEILADLIKTWINPEEKWPVARVSDDSLSDALVALQRHLANPPDGPPAIGF